MATNPDDSAADNEKAHVSAANGNGDEAVSNLPMVLAPKLGAGEDEPIEETPARLRQRLSLLRRAPIPRVS